VRVALALGSAALLSACVSGGRLREQMAAVRNDLKQARAQHAETCAPRELAVAEANLGFAELELDQGDGHRADEHVKLATGAARQALSGSRECKPVQVVMAAPAPAAQAPLPKVGLKDSDGDGVPDIDDLCPDVPGPRENRGCPMVVDSDGDGVPDDVDKCPNLPGPKENFGCPWPDRDRDGVPDKADKCPDTPGPVENQGCPWPDRDKDGVPDKDDKCPDEPGPKENQGCPRKQALIIVKKDRIEIKQQVHFSSGKARILRRSNELLRQVATAIKDAPAVRVRIEGHTDNLGRLDTNLKLSQERAQAVKDFLVKQGVQPSRLVAEGFGPTRPLKPNNTKRNRAANRRVEFRMIEDEKPAGEK
jgi:outer membrane protein OmpA-like peptidoglycan-associated protein